MNNTHPSCLPLMKTLTVSVLVGVLSACTVGPNYRRPDVPISKQFRKQDVLWVPTSACS